ncbi:MAG: UDP-N-acetylmuramoyl-tripeptide--D-alanyl-D-alanine ligase [Clostridium sp.]|nr:UDP-N-acetylmuramoyl-tripeptide--D-alanyl-D-alanine ligase [Clostridium sp.]
MELSFQELVSALEGTVIIDNENRNFNEACIDSRKVTNDCIFFAIKGERFNANNLAIDVLEKGASIAVVDEINFKSEEAEGKGIIIKVDNTVKAMLKLANFYRRKLKLKVIGVTGSCGKTSTKDLIAAVLSTKYNVFKTDGNFNSEIGLPLMIFQLTSEHDVAVLEMGMSDMGEIKRLAKSAEPDMAVITNIGLSHLENLKTQDNILKAKMEIVECFTKDNILVVNAEDERLKKQHSHNYKIEKIGYNSEYDVYASNIILKEDSVKFTANCGSDKFDFELPMAGKHNILNMMLAIDVARNLGLSFKEMNDGLVNLKATSMRLEVEKTDKIIIINDCYNASPDSMKSSIEVLMSKAAIRRVAILGDMYELGSKTKEAHQDVGSFAKGKVDLLIVIGENIENYEKGFGSENIRKFALKEDFFKEIDTLINKDDVILVKASRGMKFEEVVYKLKDLK